MKCVITAPSSTKQFCGVTQTDVLTVRQRVCVGCVYCSIVLVECAYNACASTGIPSSDTPRQLGFNQRERDKRHIELSNCHDIQPFLGTKHEKNENLAIKHVDLTIAIVVVPSVLAKLVYATITNIMCFFRKPFNKQNKHNLTNESWIFFVYLKNTFLPQKWGYILIANLRYPAKN